MNIHLRKFSIVYFLSGLFLSKRHKIADSSNFLKRNIGKLFAFYFIIVTFAPKNKKKV